MIIRKIALLLVVVLTGFAATAQTATTWTVDPAHSAITFKIKHMGLTFVPGEFDKFTGTMTASNADFSDAKISFTADVNSINTGITKRDDHLRSADFFEVEKYPEIKFVSTSFTKATKPTNNKSKADKQNDFYELKGNLTIKDVTKPVTFKVIYGGKVVDQQGNPKIGFTAKSNINRLDYNVKYDPTGQGVAKDVDIVIYLEMAPKK